MLPPAPVLPPAPIQPDASLLFQKGYESALKGITSSDLFKDNPKSVAGLISELSQSKQRFESNYSAYSRDNGAWALENSGLQPAIDKIKQELPALDAKYRSDKREGQYSLLGDVLKGDKKFSGIAEEDPSLLNTPGIASFVRQGISREQADSRKMSPSEKNRFAYLNSELTKAHDKQDEKLIADYGNLLDNFKSKSDSQPSSDSLLNPVPVLGPSAPVQDGADIPLNSLTAPLNPFAQGVSTAWGAAMGQPQNQPAAPVQDQPAAPPKSVGKYFLSDGKGNIIANASSDEVDKAIDAKYSLKPSEDQTATISDGPPVPDLSGTAAPATPTPKDVSYLAAHPEMKAKFETRFGAGSADQYLP